MRPLSPSTPPLSTPAQLLTLPPGAFTVHVSTDVVNVRDRDMLIEVYNVPEDVFD